MSRFFLRFYFSLEGRTSRLAYWMFWFLPGFLLGVIAGFFRLLEVRGALVLLLVLAPVGVWITMAVCVKRYHDFNRSGWWAVLMLIPYLNFLVALIIGFIPGKSGDNQYGSDPLATRSAL